MTTLEKGHYHCIECGSLFEAAIKDVRDQRCPVCGNPPTGKILAGTERDKELASVIRSGDPKAQPARELHGVNQDSQSILEATLEAEKNKRRGRVKRTKRREKKSKKILVMIGVWIAVMIAVVFLMQYLNPEEDDITSTVEVDAKREWIMAQAEAKKKRMVVEAAAPECEKAMTAFLNASSAAGKAQYVYQGITLSGVMNRYYQNNPSFSSTRSKIRIIRGELLDIPNVRAIGTVCQNSLGERFEAIFVHENKEWRIDWRSLVRYDAKVWSLFPSGVDGDEAVFRLYMRVRDTDQDLARQDMSVVFYKPGMYTKNEFSGLASNSVRVAIDSREGKALMKMLDSEENLEKDAYGFTIGDLDPLGYHRVRVRMRLHKEEGKETQLELVEILANHWYGEELIGEADHSGGSEGGE
ncbi:MAG: hypothetical protein H7A51_05220 [Akkermansiaceae bacterium]|nr:hypothetical protein [Akkermansiaceae bacterium]